MYQKYSEQYVKYEFILGKYFFFEMISCSTISIKSFNQVLKNEKKKQKIGQNLNILVIKDKKKDLVFIIFLGLAIRNTGLDCELFRCPPARIFLERCEPSYRNRISCTL